MKMSITTPKYAWAYGGLLLLCAGCTTPDLKPFADSTAGLHQAVTQSQGIIRSEISGIEQAGNLAHPDQVAAAKDKLIKAFDARIAFMGAVVNYSDSLAAVADAGKNGQANAKALGDSLQQLADMAGPYGMAVGAGTEIMSQIYGLIAQARAAHSLREATTKMDPAIQKAAELVQMDMTNVLNVLKAGEPELNTAIQSPFLDDMILRNKLAKIRRDEVAKISSNITANNSLELMTEYNQKITEVDKMMDRMDKWYLPLRAQQAQNSQRFATEEDFVNNTIRGFQQWAKVHADLAKALRDDRQPNIRELLSTVLEIKTEIENFKKH
jgi:hypothetical protein